MSFLPGWYTKLSRTVQPECIYYRDTLHGPLMVIIDYHPVLLSFAFFVISLYKREVAFIYFSLSMLFDLLLSIFLRNVAFASFIQRLPGCGSLHEMPSFAFQHMFFLAVLFHNVIVFRKKRTQASTVFLLYLFTLFTAVARVYIGINRITEIYVGVAIGFVEGILWTVPIFFLQHKLTKDNMFYAIKRVSLYFEIHDTVLFGIEEQTYVSSTTTTTEPRAIAEAGSKGKVHHRLSSTTRTTTTSHHGRGTLKGR